MGSQDRQDKRPRARGKEQDSAMDAGPRPKPQAKSGLGKLDDSLLFVLRSSLRVRMLVSLNEEGDGSPAEVGRRLNVPTERTSYHMKVLQKNGFAELIRKESVGSATKSIYRATRKVEFPKEVWENLPAPIQNTVLHGLFHTSYSDVEAALLSGAYERRPESHASWTRLPLDERAWRKLIKLFDGTFERAMTIGAEAEKRIEAKSIEPADILIASVTMSSFILPEGIGVEAEKKAMRHRPLDGSK
jgi:hypothetical protein